MKNDYNKKNKKMSIFKIIYHHLLLWQKIKDEKQEEL